MTVCLKWNGDWAIAYWGGETYKKYSCYRKLDCTVSCRKMLHNIWNADRNTGMHKGSIQAHPIRNLAKCTCTPDFNWLTKRTDTTKQKEDTLTKVKVKHENTRKATDTCRLSINTQQLKNIHDGTKCKQDKL